jgi:hypothetical protein
VAIIMLWLFLAHGPFWHRNRLDISSDTVFRLNHETPLKWYEYIQAFNAGLLLSALYGLFALIPFLKLRKGQAIKNGYFIGACIVGALSFIGIFLINSLARIDCGDSCSADVPSYKALYALLALSVIPLLILPIFSYARIKKLTK